MHVYWVHAVDHTDMFTQGYIGISKNIEARIKQHKKRPTNIHFKNAVIKHGWDNLLVKTIVVADKEYCLDLEKKLRPADYIGWNATMGGGIPPKPKKGMGKGRKLSQEIKDKLSKAGKGRQFSMESKEKIRQKALAQWARYRANGNKHQPLPADEPASQPADE